MIVIAIKCACVINVKTPVQELAALARHVTLSIIYQYAVVRKAQLETRSLAALR